MNKTLLAFAFAALVVAVPAFGAADVIPAGPDLWKSTDDGTTRADFAVEPIPADFFCPGSAPFAGRIGFRGVPLTTEPAGIFGANDTLVVRLDDAIFDSSGTALTRVQVTAMEFTSLAPIKNGCGTYDVRTVLDGEQPITEMQILRLRKGSGAFLAPISVRVRLVFTPRENPKRQVSLSRELDFAPAPNATWTEKPGPGGARHPEAFQVDTDGDRIVDTWIAGTTENFAAGWDIDMHGNIVQGTDDCHCNYLTCGHQHCLELAPIE